MPWITVMATPDDGVGASASVLAEDVAVVVAQATGLTPEDVIVLVYRAEACSERGAIVTVAGRPRSDVIEDALAERVRAAVARHLHIETELVAVVRI